jgi:polysaccharide biosynthesis protein PelG
VYAFSLIVVGLIQMPLTRYLSDLLFTRDFQMYLPTYTAALIVVGIVQLLTGGSAVFLLTDWTFTYACHALLLYLAVSFMWVAMIFVSTVKDFHSVALAFVIGGLLSLGAGYYLGEQRGTEGYLVGYAIGQLFIFLMLTLRVAIEFPSPLGLSFDFLRYLKRYPTLVVIGFFYNLAIWIDKLIFWFSPTGQRIDSFLYACEQYDLPMYVAYLTIVPSLSLFLIRIETSFYQFYKNFYGAIIGKKSLQVIRQQKQAMFDSIKLSTIRLLKLQGVITLLTILLVPYLFQLLHYNWLHLNILRIGTLAAFLHALLLLLSICMLYFEFRLETLGITVLFCLLNALGTYYTIGLGVAFYGYGYFAACFLTLLLGLFVMDYKFKNLEYITFVMQPSH